MPKERASANNLPMSRRTFMTLVPAPVAIMATPSGAGMMPTPSDDPIRRWLDQWKVARADLDGTEEDSAAEKACFAEMYRLEDLIAETPARTSDGVLAKLEWILADTAPDCFPCPQHREALDVAVTAMKGGMV